MTILTTNDNPSFRFISFFSEREPGVKRAFSLIEVMVAIAICLSVASFIGVKVHDMIVKKRFSACVERISSRLLTCRRLALNMQADWQSDLFASSTGVILSSECVDLPETKPLPSLHLGSYELFFNEKKIEKISFAFTASGDILPFGRLEIRGKSTGSRTIDVLELFSMKEGKNLGPSHPEDW